MANIVTQRFVECHNTLKSMQKVRSSRQFALSIDTLPQSLNEVLKGNRDATVKSLTNVVDVYGISERFLLSGEGPMFKSELPCLEVVADVDSIEYVPTPAYAGNMDQFIEDVKVQDLETFSIPGYQSHYGEHRCYDVAGNSMEPTLYAGDMVICSKVPISNNYNCIKDNHIYVVVTTNEILVKRVENQISTKGILRLLSDNSADYKTVDMPIQEIREVWRVNRKVAQVLPGKSPQGNELLEKIDNLEQIIKGMINNN